MKKRDDIYASQIHQRIESVKKHLKGMSQDKFLKSDLHKSAVVRELEVIGEAANKISNETKMKFPKIPWEQIVGMRNRLIHEYFDVDYSIVWEVANKELPGLEKEIESVYLGTAPSAHPWRNCPLGYYYVHEHSRTIHASEKHPDGKTDVRAHCRRNPTGKDQIYPGEISIISNSKQARESINETLGKLDNPNNANEYDDIIKIWVKYWNDVFVAKDPLSAKIVKALFFSESSFNLKVKDQRIRAGNFARGPLQISDQTRKILADEKGELKDHFMTLTSRDVKNVDVALAAATRWLFHKKDMATKYLGRTATWEEAVADYKGYLRSKADFRKQVGMKKFFSTWNILKQE